jgi:RHS repeat-associated protein
VTLDPFDRPTVLNDPINATNFTTSYGADGQPATLAAPNGNTTAFAYDAVGHLVSKDTTAPGPVNRALYDWTYNRAGQNLSETSSITGDPSNGTRVTAYDPLSRLTGSTIAGATTTYGWDKVPNRTSVQVGGGAIATTAYDAANRPTSGSNPTAAYTNDADGYLTTRPGQRLEWDHLGRLTKVRPPTGGGTIVEYTYDPLDRLRMADYGGSNRVRFRYVGTTTTVAQTIDDQTGAVIRNFGTGWGGERLLDWTGAGSNLRFYGENSHHDVTWTASSTGAVSATLRYDPWGTITASTGSSLPDHRFQGSWYDVTTDLSWAVTRWYAPALGRFISEDVLLGERVDPPSQHLYAYGAGDPIGSWDPDGRTSFKSYPLRNSGHFRGTLVLSLFIAAHYNYTSVPFGTLRFRGDNRSWGPRCDQSRGCVTVYFSSNKVVARVNNTCTAVNFLWSDWIDLGCASAFPIVTSPLPYTCLRPPSGSCGYPQQYNLVKVVESGSTIKIVWDITQAGAPIVRPGLTVNGSMTIRPAACCVYAPTIEYHGDGFPSEELYWYSPSWTTRRTVFRHPEGPWQDMASGDGDWHRTYTLPQ